MKPPYYLKSIALLLVAFTGIEAAHAVLLRHALRQNEKQFARRLSSSIAPVLNSAHKAKDDLTLDAVLRGLSQAPGVITANISSNVPSGMFCYPLRDKSGSWGHLVLFLSPRLGRRLLWRHTAIDIGIAAIVFLAIGFIHLRLEIRANRLFRNVGELSKLLEAERLRREGAEKRESLARAESVEWLNAALGEMSHPLILLDAQQRIVGVSAKAGEILQAVSVGQSWQDVPELREFGQALAESLDAPERPVRAVNNPFGRAIEFMTRRSANGMSAGTWVRFP